MYDYEDYLEDLEAQIEAAEWEYEYLRDEGLLRSYEIKEKEEIITHIGGE